MVAPRYTPDQLRRLRESPLVVKPDNLPSIEQWVDIGQTKPRTQSGFGRDADDVLRRPIFENRQASKQSKGTEDIFLGPPKVSFGSTLSKSKTADSASTATGTENAKNKHDRLGGRDRPRRDREYESAPRRDRDNDRERHEQSNGFESRSRLRVPRSLDTEEEGHSKPKDRNTGGRDVDDKNERQEEGEVESGPKRHVFGRGGRFDQPWFRGEDSEEPKNGSSNKEGGWRDHHISQGRDWQKITKTERDPEWMNDAGKGDRGADHTQEDFQKWKDKMRASATGNEDKESEILTPPPIASTGSPTAQDQGTMNFFGMWGEEKKEESAEGTVLTSKTAATKPKPSRFAGFFAPHSQSEPGPAVPSSPSMASSEDKEGFQRVLQMLGSRPRTLQGGLEMQNDAGGSILPRTLHQPDVPSQEHELGSPDRAAIQPTSGQERWLESMQHDRATMHHLRQDESERQTSLPSHETLRRMTSGQDPSRPSKQAPNADSAFLLNLMQQPRNPFNEGQVYGQPFRQDNPNGVSAVLNDISNKTQSAKSPLPPPGFFDDRPYHQNPPLDPRFHMGHVNNHPDGLPDRFDHNRPPRDDFERMHIQMPPNIQRDPGPGPPFWSGGNRPPSRTKHDMMSPPGIGRGPLSPGFPPQFISGPIPPPNVPQPQQQQQHRGVPSPFPPGFGGPPPGFGQPGMLPGQQVPHPGYQPQRPGPGPNAPQFDGYPQNTRREAQPGAIFPGFMKQ